MKKVKEEENQIEATRTEIQTSADTALIEALKQAHTKDHALVVIQGDHVGQVFRISESQVRIGRHPNSDLCVNQRAVSAQHAQIKIIGEEAFLEDLKSTNGTFVNGERISLLTPLRAGDLVKIGATVFKYIDTRLDSQFTENLHNKGNRDPMTGVYNKNYFMNLLSSSLEVAKGGFPLSLVLFDLDHFKKINDTWGHLAGDYVLIETCRILSESVVRTDDVFARYGGEEFAIVLPDSHLKVAVTLAERIRKTLENHVFLFEEKKIPVTASLGVISWSPRFKTVDSFIQAADEKLYEAKKLGRNRVVHDPL